MLLDNNGNLIIIDWALARYKLFKIRPAGPDNTIAHPVCGTPGYIAREVLQGKSTGTACDIYSLGVIFGEWLSLYIPDCGKCFLIIRRNTILWIETVESFSRIHFI
jgi:serine/threonine protein kinase